jgi:hypothetical protein
MYVCVSWYDVLHLGNSRKFKIDSIDKKDGCGVAFKNRLETCLGSKVFTEGFFK